MPRTPWSGFNRSIKYQLCFTQIITNIATNSMANVLCWHGLFHIFSLWTHSEAGLIFFANTNFQTDNFLCKTCQQNPTLWQSAWFVSYSLWTHLEGWPIFLFKKNCQTDKILWKTFFDNYVSGEQPDPTVHLYIFCNVY